MEIECSKPCGGGFVIRKRTCRFLPCIDSTGNATEAETAIDEEYPCNTLSCSALEGTTDNVPVVFAKDSTSDSYDKQCVFPFVFNYIKHSKCIDIEPPTERGLDRYQGAASWCGLVSDLNQG